MLECRDCEHAVAIKEITEFEGHELADENKIYVINCLYSGVNEICGLDSKRPFSCEKYERL